MSFENSSVVIRAIGSYVPEKRLTNEELSKIVDTNDEWITTRTGIKERRIAGETIQVSDMATEAAKLALERSGVAPEDIDLVIVATLSPETLSPSSACLIQDKLGLRKVPAFDLNAACSGFIYGLDIGKAMLSTGKYRNALVVGVEKLSAFTNMEDRGTCILFGDGAGACVISYVDEPDQGIIDCQLGSDGINARHIVIPAGGSKLPANEQTLKDGSQFLQMNGREVFKVAVRAMGQACEDILKKNDLTSDDITVVIPHQANIRIIEAIASKLELPMDHFFVNIQKYGNTSAASIPIAIDEANIERNFKKGDLILLVAFGAGLTWGASLIKWY